MVMTVSLNHVLHSIASNDAGRHASGLRASATEHSFLLSR